MHGFIWNSVDDPAIDEPCPNLATNYAHHIICWSVGPETTYFLWLTIGGLHYKTRTCFSPYSGARQAKANVVHEETEPVSIMHPEAARVESIMRNAWADAKLVGD